MRQTVLSATLEVKPESTAKLTALIDQLHNNADHDPAGSDQFGWFMRKVPCVHFLSMNVFRAADYDPVFVIEANFDGTPGPFWAQLESAIGEDLRAMLRCCKQPLDEDGALYAALVAPGSRRAVAAYLDVRAQRPSVFHQGNRGMTRDRILAERDLFVAIREEFVKANDGGASPYRGPTPAAIHDRLRAAMMPAFPWLGNEAPARVTTVEHIVDWVKFVAFIIVAVLALSLPGLILAPVTPTLRFFILLAIAAIAILVPLYRIREPLKGTGVSKPWALVAAVAKALPLVALGVAVYALIAVPVTALAFGIVSGRPFDHVIAAGLRMVLLGLASAVLFSVPGLLLWIRYLERRDSAHDAPPIDEEEMRQMVQREDWIPQNHMGSIVLLKPGMLRTIIVHGGHLALHLLLRAKATDGYLGSMRTVHFAHWAFVNNGGRLMFFSNFDQSWESYLDDFIEKAHVGLTLAWGCGAGFPATRFLILDGASHGTKFKAWARHSMAVSRFWYSAYPDLTVDQIERNNRIANALRKPALSEKEAAAWIDEL